MRIDNMLRLHDRLVALVPSGHYLLEVDDMAETRLYTSFFWHVFVTDAKLTLRAMFSRYFTFYLLELFQTKISL